jgi:hypothetical protein
MRGSRIGISIVLMTAFGASGGSGVLESLQSPKVAQATYRLHKSPTTREDPWRIFRDQKGLLGPWEPKGEHQPRLTPRGCQ